jgi:hypothetical protein
MNNNKMSQQDIADSNTKHKLLNRFRRSARPQEQVEDGSDTLEEGFNVNGNISGRIIIAISF